MDLDLNQNVDLAALIHRGGVFFDIEGSTPQEIYKTVSGMITLPDELTSEQIYNALCAREQVLSTAVGNGIALPHARASIIKNIEQQQICVVYLKNPIDMQAPDEREVYVMFVLLTQNSQVHLKVLTELAGLFRNLRFRKALESHAGEAELLSLIRELDK
ncbi:MAG: PTS sugar transporter subunit IIA [Treponema sp.]|nr:PTS sugar transporter subunit IIA [Treponema sp.]